MSKPLDRCTKAELLQIIRIKDAQISQQNQVIAGYDHRFAVQNGQIIGLKNQLEEWATTELTPCYQCGVPSPQLSKRSRCCHCECERSLFNEAELESIQDRSNAAAEVIDDSHLPHMTMAQLSRKYCGEKKLKCASAFELHSYAQAMGIVIVPTV